METCSGMGQMYFTTLVCVAAGAGAAGWGLVAVGAVGSGTFMPAACSAGGACGAAHLLERLAELALRIEEELARGHDALALVQPAENLVGVILPLRPEHNGARLEPAAFQREKRCVLLAAAQNRRVGHQQDRRGDFREDLDGRKHAGLEKVPGVMKLHAHTVGPAG